MNDELKQLVLEIASIKSGDVFQFLMLQEPCPPAIYRDQRLLCRLERQKFETNREYTAQYTKQDWLNHCWCQGHGWLPVISFKALFEALDSIGFNLVNFSTYGKVVVVETAISVRSDGWTTGRAEEEAETTIEEVRLLALARALKNACFKMKLLV